MKDFHPINLYNVVYKLIAKTLVDKLKRVLESMISPTSRLLFQVEASLITLSLALSVCIHAINNKRYGKEGEVAMKLDMSKAMELSMEGHGEIGWFR